LTILILLIALLSGCAATRAVIKPQATLELTASEGVNPDVQGRPSPLAIKIYQLASRTEFDVLDFDEAFYRSEAPLGDSLLSVSERMLLPNEAARHRVVLDRKARFIAVVAAYRAIDTAKWKLVYPVSSNRRQTHEVYLQADGIELGE
jgi:type VI secretion system protein VasD